VEQDEKEKEIKTLLRLILLRSKTMRLTGCVKIEINFSNGGVRNFFSHWRVEEPSKLLAEL